MTALRLLHVIVTKDHSNAFHAIYSYVLSCCDYDRAFARVKLESAHSVVWSRGANIAILAMHPLNPLPQKERSVLFKSS